MSEHYFTKKPTSPVRMKKVRVIIGGHQFVFTTVSGVFSFGRVDPGSLLLLNNLEISGEATVLDLGCGWGLVGIVVKRLFPNATVLCTDVNERAVEFTRQNAQFNRVKVVTHQKMGYGNKKCDAILLNPPMKAGREVCYSLIEEAKKHLTKNGSLQLVALHNRGGKMLETKMSDVFGNVKTLAKKGGFRVYISYK